LESFHISIIISQGENARSSCSGLSPTVPSTSNIGCAQQLLVGGVKTSNTASFTWNDGMPWDAYANSLWATGAPHTGSNADTAQLTLFTYGSNQRGRSTNPSPAEENFASRKFLMNLE
jgi:hypothetical protein